MLDVTKQAEKEFETEIIYAAEEVFREDARFEIRPEGGSIVPKELTIDHKLQSRIEKGEFNHLFPQGADPIDMMYSTLNKIRSVRDFVIGNQKLTGEKKVRSEIFKLDEGNFERIYKALESKENEINLNSKIRDDFRFRFDDMVGISGQINTAKVKRELNEIRNKFNPNHAEFNEILDNLVKNNMLKSAQQGLDLKIPDDLSKLPIIKEKDIEQRDNGHATLQELHAIRNFVYQMLSAHGRNVYTPSKEKGYYPGQTESQIRDMQRFLEEKGIPMDLRTIDEIGHEIVYAMQRDAVGSTNLTYGDVKLLQDFSIEIGKDTDESNVFSLTGFNPIRTDKVNGYFGRILETRGLSKENKIIAERFNEELKILKVS